MDKSTQSASSGLVADAGAAIATISTPNPESEARLRALVAERGPALRIRLHAPTDFDVSGHQLNATPLTLDVVDEDDTEGHTISLHFPRVQDAKQFEQRLIATGAIVGTLVIGGSGLALSQALPDASTTPSTQAQVESTTSGQGADDLTYPGAISPSTGGALTGKEEALLTEMTGADAVGTSGGQVGISPSSGGALTGKEEGLLTVIIGDEAETSGGQVGTSSSSADPLTGKEEGLLTAITGDEDK
jgi:hypothetical protein